MITLQQLSEYTRIAEPNCSAHTNTITRESILADAVVALVAEVTRLSCVDTRTDLEEACREANDWHRMYDERRIVANEALARAIELIAERDALALRLETAEGLCGRLSAERDAALAEVERLKGTWNTSPAFLAELAQVKAENERLRYTSTDREPFVTLLESVKAERDALAQKLASEVIRLTTERTAWVAEAQERADVQAIRAEVAEQSLRAMVAEVRAEAEGHDNGGAALIEDVTNGPCDCLSGRLRAVADRASGGKP